MHFKEGIHIKCVPSNLYNNPVIYTGKLCFEVILLLDIKQHVCTKSKITNSLICTKSRIMKFVKKETFMY